MCWYTPEKSGSTRTCSTSEMAATACKATRMHDDRRLVEARINREVDQWVVPAIHGPSAPFTIEAWDVPGEPVSYGDAMRAAYSPFELGSRWGARPWGTTWFKFHGAAPADWVLGPDEEIEARIDLGFFPNGVG